MPPGHTANKPEEPPWTPLPENCAANWPHWIQHQHAQLSASPKAGVVVRWSVRKPTGGLPFVFEYKAPPGAWRTTAEHDARTAIVRAGLRPWVHIETLEG